ncbi:phytanoyl-CoA dioxygenase family protein [Sphingomonas sp. RS6]
MARLGQLNRVGFDHAPEGGVKPYAQQVAEGIRRDSWLGRKRFLARLNYAHNYIWWLRAASNDPERLARLARIERLVRQPFARPWKTERAAEFRKLDFHFEEKLLDPEVVGRLAHDLVQPQTYSDPYIMGYRHVGLPQHDPHPFLYMDPQTLFLNPAFLEICSNQGIIDFCREALGPRAALSWAWTWISQPAGFAYQNQNWHRDAAEPLNFVRIFVPLSPILAREDGATELIPGTSRLRQCYERRRFGDHEVEALKQERGAGVVLADVGDVYFINTFALHRGTPPTQRRGLLSLLVSIGPSHRTPFIRKLHMNEIPEHLRERFRRNRSFFRRLVR